MLDQLSYCARCGAGFTDTGPCVPDGHEAERRAPGWPLARSPWLDADGEAAP